MSKNNQEIKVFKINRGNINIEIMANITAGVTIAKLDNISLFNNITYNQIKHLHTLKGKSKCNPEDRFNTKIGAYLATSRLLTSVKKTVTHFDKMNSNKFTNHMNSIIEAYVNKTPNPQLIADIKTK